MNKIYRSLILFLIYFGCIQIINAQTYSLYPNDTVQVIEKMAHDAGIKIHQHNLTSVPINLKYRKISVYFPTSDYSGKLCDNGVCYPWLPDSGAFMPIGSLNSGNDWADLYVIVRNGYDSAGNSVGVPGTATIRYALWDVMNPTHIDTLTFIFTTKAYTYNGLNSNNLNFSVEVMPNPANRELQLSINEPCSNYNIEITSIRGEIVYKSQNEMNIDISGFAKGVYLLKVTSAQGKTFNRKFVKL